MIIKQRKGLSDKKFNLTNLGVRTKMEGPVSIQVFIIKYLLQQMQRKIPDFPISKVKAGRGSSSLLNYSRGV